MFLSLYRCLYLIKAVMDFLENIYYLQVDAFLNITLVYTLAFDRLNITEFVKSPRYCACKILEIQKYLR